MGITGRQRGTRKPSSSSKKKAQQPPLSEEDKAATLEMKTQQHDLESLQITFYEIESWIEKTTPLLSRMTKELDKASAQFDKRRRSTNSNNNNNNNNNDNDNDNNNNNRHSSITQPISVPSSWSNVLPQQSTSVPLSATRSTTTTPTCPMQWSMSFQPNNSMRLETNIKSVDQLVEAVQQIRLMTEPDNVIEDTTTIPEDDFLPGCNGLFTHHHQSPSPSLFASYCTDPSIEYWQSAIGRRPIICLEEYKHCNMNINRLTKDVSANVMHYICHLYWDCLHPKFSSDWTTFWDRCGDPKRNQLCIDSGLAMVFLHGTRHRKDICANVKDIAFFYYDRARDNLMDYFDTPHCATLETLMNLSMFCILCKRHSQSRIYIGLGLRMMLEMGMHRRATLPQNNPLLRKKYLKFFMVLYYNDIQSSLYSGEPALLDDNDCDIDFYEMIALNKTLQDTKLSAYDDKIIEKETFFAHLLALAKIGKQALQLVNDYQKQRPQPHRIHGDLPYRWAKRLQSLEIDLSQWYNRLPDYYRVDPQPQSQPPTFSQHPLQHTRHQRRQQQQNATEIPNSPPLHYSTTGEYPHSPMSADDLRAQSALLLMLQYQTQWIILHKTFFNNTSSTRCSPYSTPPPAFTPTSPSPLSTTPTKTSTNCPGWDPKGTIYQWQRQCTDRSQAICADAANRIVVIAEVITEQFGWCVCQQFISCIYQASTIFCRNAIANNQSITPERQHADAMIQRIVRILAVSTINYEGLPDDLTFSLMELLNSHSALPTSTPHTTTTTTTTMMMDDNRDIDSNTIAQTLSHNNEYTENNYNDNINSNSMMEDDFDFIPTWKDTDSTQQEGTKDPCYFSMNNKTLYVPSSPTLSSSPSPASLSTPQSISLDYSALSDGSHRRSHLRPTQPQQQQQQQKEEAQLPLTLNSPLLPTTLHGFDDTLPNSPHMYQQCLTQPRIRSTRNTSLMADQSPTEAMLSIKLKDPTVDEAMAMEKTNATASSWRSKFSSPSVAAGNQRII
ncbi:uncharacterized protein BX664DRAFT_356335 [Halteromyces radiatus]|uniref:uncharacterized protein n=1 Tax=Halteromyces radiatus TaxID=101107 RepID=UPI0022203F7D|nr:uncharacterized protein BX664DRAFT_356335 [Halteromyces radiatus]KAI8097051.1 hypothetical protein BX664DRAFT_356335 [Halteromyces radiatus]